MRRKPFKRIGASGSQKRFREELLWRDVISRPFLQKLMATQVANMNLLRCRKVARRTRCWYSIFEDLKRPVIENTTTWAASVTIRSAIHLPSCNFQPEFTVIERQDLTTSFCLGRRQSNLLTPPNVDSSVPDRGIAVREFESGVIGS